MSTCTRRLNTTLLISSPVVPLFCVHMDGLAPGFASDGGTGASSVGAGLPLALPQDSELDQVRKPCLALLLSFAVGVKYGGCKLMWSLEITQPACWVKPRFSVLVQSFLTTAPNEGVIILFQGHKSRSSLWSGLAPSSRRYVRGLFLFSPLHINTLACCVAYRPSIRRQPPPVKVRRVLQQQYTFFFAM